ncbi:oligosaccharide flippase family protein [Capnocytophaga cynodegmi]|uniref:Polysaccharide biosynthesis protein n=1 Tax=Capnocytophaga cynodegmi TaxID=28189 RepID=A0A0B7HU30_9FLAO|nr:oligosaccharide flippase family protein [Capnocytophaga cynodegmi]CEN37823.1 conserved membrane hypothetical protein [Capnocytophaga cynodegmi]CEN41422.1 conserved membrane hypothetical protein [Capnocytophaga cynodegmi]
MCCKEIKKKNNEVKIVIKNNRLLLSNISYLGVFQILLALVPLLTYPYLIRVVGEYNYGLVAYAQAISAILVIIVNFGINIYATKDVAENRDTPEKLNKIISTVYLLKGTIFFIVGFFYLSTIFIFDFFSENKFLFALVYGYCLSEWLLPVWYFQGIEKMRYMVVIDSVSKIFFTFLIFILITSETDFIRIPILQILGNLVGALIAFYLLFYKEKRTVIRVNYRDLIKYLKTSFPFFLSRLSVVGIAQLTTIFIGRTLGYIEVSWYDLAKKIWGVFMLPANVINTAIYPRIAYTKSVKMVHLAFNFLFIGSIVLYIVLLLFTPFVVKILGGEQMLLAVPSVRFYGIMIILCYLTYFLGSCVMIPFGFQKQFNLSVIYSFFLFSILILILYLLSIKNLYGFISVILFSELAILLYRLKYSYQYIKR